MTKTTTKLNLFPLVSKILHYLEPCGQSQGMEFVSQSLGTISKVILDTAMELLQDTLVCLLTRHHYCQVKKPLCGWLLSSHCYPLENSGARSNTK